LLTMLWCVSRTLLLGKGWGAGDVGKQVAQHPNPKSQINKSQIAYFRFLQA